uniref:U-box domain-containing protein n=1 Tax=Paramoeba aestuarina TaxID=180227 RepID=A0A7S4KV60_9EUKA
MTLKSMNASFVQGGDGGDVESETQEENADEGQSRETSREGRIQSLQGHMAFANQVLVLLSTLCQEIPNSLLQGLVACQVAYALDYFLTQLAGPRMEGISSVPVEVLKEAGFDHRGIVEKLVRCYVGIASSGRRDAFTEAICTDGHYYSPESFRQIFRFLEAKAVCPDLLPKLKGFFSDIEKSFAERKRDDELFNDPPNEFVCQITYELLKEPLRLPGMDDCWVESQAILHHLLFDETNPFNRQVLTSSDLLKFNYQPENAAAAKTLVENIETWKEEKRKESTEKNS